MLDFTEFLSEKNDAENKKDKLNKKKGKLKRNLHVKLDKFKQHNQVLKKKTLQDVGGGNYNT